MIYKSDSLCKNSENTNKSIHKYSKEEIEKYIAFYKQNIENKDINIFNYNYNSIIKRTANLIKELNITNPIETSVIFEYLLWNGYFSKNKKICFSKYNRIINLTALGADIMRGKTVCLNNSDMLSRLLRELKYTSYMIACNINLNQNSNICYKPNIKQIKVEKKKHPNIIDMTKRKKLNNLCNEIVDGNHISSIVFYNNQYFVIDPTNLGIMHLDNFSKAKFYFSNITAEILLWPLLALEGLSEKEFSKIINYQNINLDENHSTITESLNYINISSNAVELCKKNLSLINDFYIANYQDIDSICKTLKYF